MSQQHLKSSSSSQQHIGTVVSVGKTKATIFDKSFSRQCATNLSLYISGAVVKHVEHFEYLGIIVDDKLSFRHHISKCSCSANNSIYTN